MRVTYHQQTWSQLHHEDHDDSGHFYSPSQDFTSQPGIYSGISIGLGFIKYSHLVDFGLNSSYYCYDLITQTLTSFLLDWPVDPLKQGPIANCVDQMIISRYSNLHLFIVTLPDAMKSQQNQITPYLGHSFDFCSFSQAL